MEMEYRVHFSREIIFITLLICWVKPSQVGHHGRQNKGLPNIATSSSSEPVNMLPYMAKETVRVLKWEVILCYLGGPGAVMRVLVLERGRQESQRREDGSRGCVMELIAGFEDGERARESRHGFCQLEKELDSLLEPLEGAQS